MQHAPDVAKPSFAVLAYFSHAVEDWDFPVSVLFIVPNIRRAHVPMTIVTWELIPRRGRPFHRGRAVRHGFAELTLSSGRGEGRVFFVGNLQ